MTYDGTYETKYAAVVVGYDIELEVVMTRIDGVIYNVIHNLVEQPLAIGDDVYIVAKYDEKKTLLSQKLEKIVNL